MILIDTSVWIDHLRRGEPALAALLQNGEVLMHPFVVGEIALGSLGRRAEVLASMKKLTNAVAASDAEVLDYVESQPLHGRGIGFIDAHLLASAILSSASIWTRDRRLRTVAEELGLHDADLL